MKSYWTLPAAAALMIGAAACHGDFLSGGELSSDPNRPNVAANTQLFVGVQSNTFYAQVGDLTRISAIFAQQFFGALQQYRIYDQYNIDESTTNGYQRLLYGPGGLKDVRLLQAGAIAVKDSTLLGIAQVQEALLMGFNADAFGDVVYSQALGSANPALDQQLAVYDSIQTLLSTAITNLTATGASNIGPGAADLVYGPGTGRTVILERAAWTEFAHTLKARYYMHTAEARPAAYADAAVEAAQGISSDANNYHGVYSGNTGEQNPWWTFNSTRVGYLIPSSRLDSILVVRNDPRRTNYYLVVNGIASALSPARNNATYPQPIATYTETQLILAEASFRNGQILTAQNALVNARVNAGYAAGIANYGGTPPTGTALLREILTEKYIANFQLGLEAWKDYRRTCFPNLPGRSPTSAPMPGRFYYDQNERLTNTSVPAGGTDPNGIRNQADLVNGAADGIGGACQAGA